MLSLWMMLLTLNLCMDKISSSGCEYDKTENWKAECIYNFYKTSHVKSIGILYSDESDYQQIELLNSFANRGMSSSVFELPVGNFSNVLETISFWKSVGIHHILFLQSIDKELLCLWIQILREICDDTWWLFYSVEASLHLLRETLTKRNCLTQRWIVCPENCSTFSKYSRSLKQDMPPSMFLDSSNIHFPNMAELTNISANDEDSPKLIRLAVNAIFVVIISRKYCPGQGHSAQYAKILGASILSPPYLTLNVDEDGTVKLKDGPDAEILRMIAEKLGFQYNISLSPDGEWGRKRRGNWTGLIGMLARNEADIAAGCITMTYGRYGPASFSFPYDIQNSVIISKTPEIKPKTYAVLLPFKYDVWLMVFFMLLVFLFLLFGFGKFQKVIYLRRSYKLDRIFMYMIGSICAEGGWLTFKIKGSGAVLLGLWLLFVLVMQASYCGTLMSVLTFPAYEPSIDRLSDLAKAIVENGYKCGCLKGTFNCDTLMDLRGDLKVIADVLHYDGKNFVRSVQAGLNRVLDGKYVFVAQQIGSMYESQMMNKPYFHMSADGLDIELFSFSIRKGLPYLKDIDRIILQLSEAGLIAKWRDDVTSSNTKEYARKKREVAKINPLSLKQLTGAIYMFFYGLLFAIIALVYECTKAKCLNKH